MKPTIKTAIYKALVENHWLNVKYKNRENKEKIWYLAIDDIDVERGTIIGESFNPFKSNECLDDKVYIKIDGILDAIVMEETYYPTRKVLLDELGKPDSKLYKYLEVDTLDNNILKYLVECYKHDNDPFLKESALIDGVIPEEFKEKDLYDLDDKQFASILNTVFKKYKYDDLRAVQDTQQMGMNVCSVNIGDKQFVIAYHALTVNFKNKTLKLNKEIYINKSFLIDEGCQVTLNNYIEITPDEFVEKFKDNHREYIEMIKDGLDNSRGEIINTDPSIFLLSRKNFNDLERACNSIKDMEEQGSLTIPLKAFFGRSRVLRASTKNPEIVVSDAKKINIDQMRVVFNSMVNHVTYVKGPPGTGKTETIFNVVLSAIANKKKVLICSNNNHPLNDIYDKLMSSFTWVNPYTEKEETVLFPALRVYNNNETPKTLEALRNALRYAESVKGRKVNEDVTDKSKEKSLEKNAKLREILRIYEENQERLEDLERLEKLKELSTTEKVKTSIEEQIRIKEQKVKESRHITNEEVASLATSAKDDKNFKDYLHYYFIALYKKLLNEGHTELRRIIEASSKIENVQSCVKEFNEYIRSDGTLKKLLEVFPVIVCTNNSSDKLGSPIPNFDLVIMDEAGQCNMASSLIPITRGEDLLLVGDTNQLQPVTVIDSELNEKYRNEYGIKKEYDYVDNSILSCMTAKDKNSKSLLLRYHYRCANKIASFPNARYYNDQLQLLNQNPGSLVYVDVHNSKNPQARNSYLMEAKEIVGIIKEGKYEDVGIITPFVNQAKLINELLSREGIHHVRAGTIHTLQGSEKSTIIMSSAVSLRTSKRTMAWLENNSELINVGVTRAKDRLIFVSDKEAIDIHSKGRNTDLKALSDYVANNGKILPPKSDNTIITDFSNDSMSEQMFFDTIRPYFNRRGTKFRIERNVQVSDAIKGVSREEEMSFGRKEFDIVISASRGLFNNRYAPIVVFEIDGGEHIGMAKRAESDRKKEHICKNYGITMIRIANSDVKDYELIIQLFERTVGLNKESEEMVQGSIFDDEAIAQA